MNLLWIRNNQTIISEMPNMTIAYCPPNIIRSVTACYHGKDSQNYYSASPKISITWWTPELTCCWSPKECFIFFGKVVSFARTMVLLILIRHRVAYFVGLSDCGSLYFPDMTSVNDQMWNPDIFICRQKIKFSLSIFIYERKDFEKKRQSTRLSI